MKTISITLAASLALTTSAQPHAHNHARHHHPRPVARAIDTEVFEVVEKVYIAAGGGAMTNEEAEACLASGACTIVGSTGAYEGGSSAAGVFKEEEEVEVEVKEETTTSATTTSTKEVSSPTAEAESSSESANYDMTNIEGVDVEFPDNVYDCDTLPSGFGAISADYLGMSGWLGIQWGTSNIVTGISGETCTADAYCSYLCPEGYEKAQWPETQGSNGESIGGIYCNSDNKLVKSRSEVNTLCQAGKGGISVTSSLSETVFMCRTDYPGTEAMLIPIEVAPGTTHDVTNPSQTDYLWQGMKTSAQYYINKLGLDRDQACTWDSDHLNLASAGDKAPTNFGTGVDDGTTYFSIFPNAAVSDAVLDFNVKISVDGEITCTLIDGVYSTSDAGCTGGTSGGSVLIEFY